MPEAWPNRQIETTDRDIATSSLRVCMVAYAFYEIDTRILQYAAALVEQGHSVDVIALRRDVSWPEYEVLDGVNVYRIQLRTLNEKGLFAFISRVCRFLVRAARFLHTRQSGRAYDLVHIHNVPDFLVFAGLSAKLRGAPIILDIHDLLPEFYASKFKISHSSLLFKCLCIVERWSAAFASHVIIANDLWKDRLVSRSSSAEKCSVVRNRPDLSIFTQGTPGAGSRSDKFLLTYPGSLNWHQGVDIAIRAFAMVADQMPDAEFHIYGEGAAKPDLMALTAELGLQTRVLFHEFLPSRAIAQVMAATDLAIEPKRSRAAFGNEALSTKILEFMILGVPVIASRTAIHAYYYDESLVQYFDNDDPADLARQILLVRYDRPLREALVKNARSYAQANTWDCHKGEYLQLVDTLVGKSRSPTPSPNRIIPATR